MAQTIKHRRGSVASVRNITSFGEAEIVIGSGSVDSKIDGPFVYIGKPGGTTAANDYVPVSKLYAGAGVPSIVTANFGTTLDGLPYYDTTNKKLYILGASGDGTSGHTEITITTASLQNFDTHVSSSAAAAGFGSGGSGIFELVSGTIYASSDKNLQISGSGGKYALEVSESVHAYNINVGNPTSNDWQTNLDGSYFNNFNADTDVSEILRFVAGLLSSSAANPTPNTKTYSSISENKTLGSTTSAPAGYVPQDNDIADIQYLIHKGFASEGGTLFPGKTIYSSATPLISYTSVAGGSTSVQSSGDPQLFGLGALTSGGPTEFRVSGSHDWKFYQSQTAISGDTATETSTSAQILSNSSFATQNGLTIAKIQTVNPAVIPAAFQDGKFASVFSKNLVNWTAQSLSSVSSSGQYKIDTTIGIATGSQSTYVTKAADETIFWAPVSTINTNLGAQTLSYSGDTVTPLTLTSGSMSGAPYVDGGTWNLVATASGLFEPLYAASTTLGDVTIGQFTSNGTVTVSNTSGVDTLSTSGGDVSTANAVYSSDGNNTVRSTGTHPFRTDNFHINADYSIGGSGNTFDESGTTDSDFTLAIKGRNREGTQSTLVTKTVALHTAGQFGQPAASGSMGYFGGGTSNTALIEYFTSESYRREIGSPTVLTTAWDESSRLTLGNGGDLQVKPGYLVNPESSNGYWYPTGGYNAAHYKWYLREFDTSAGANLATLTINLDPDSSSDLATFDTTTSGKIAVGVIFEAQLPANSGDTRTTVFDAVRGSGTYNAAYDNQSSDNQLNPFSSAIDLQADFSSGTSNSNGILTLKLNNPIGQVINGTYGKVWVLIRYTGTPSNTLERITISAS